MALLALVLPAAWIILRPPAGPARTAGKRLALTALAVSALSAAGALLATNAAVGRSLARFDFTGEFRPELWRDSLYAARQYLPWGSGMGGFVPVFEAAERLEVVDPTRPNRAHNDYLELAVEAGVPGLLTLGAIVALLVRAARRSWDRGDAGSRGQLLFAGSALILKGFHSFVDYPLRSMSLACLAAVCAGMLIFPGDGAKMRRSAGGST
jgi:O-antigen ligase